MRVLHLIGGGDVGGAKTHLITLLSGLSGKIKASLVSFREGEFAEDCRKAGIEVFIADGGYLSEIAAVRKLMNGYDILHCHGARANMVGAILKRRIKKPIVTTVHSDYKLDYMGRPLARVTFGLINAFALRRFDYHIGVSEPMTRLLMSRGFSPERQYTIYNGIEFKEHGGIPDKGSMAKEFGIEHQEGNIYAGIAARFDPVKDMPTFIRAAGRLKDSCPKLHFLIAGNGKQEQFLRQLAQECGARVHFCGWVRDMESFFKLLDVNVLTSLSETFPYSLTEGARCKCATVATSVGGIPILIDHGVNGLIFTPGDDEALAGHIKRLYDNPEFCAKLGKKLYDKGKRDFSVEVTLKMQLDIYESILRRRRRPKACREGLTLCGAYGMDNAGDDAILEAILTEIRELDPDVPVRVLSRNPAETRDSYREKAFYTFNVFTFTRAALKSKVYLSGGGNLVQDATSTRSLMFYLFTIWWARLLGCRVLMYGCGIGPVDLPANRKRTRKVLSKCVEYITLREEGSEKELESMGVSGPKIVITADPALRLEPEPEEKIDSLMLSQGLSLQGRYICFALRRWNGLAEKLADIGKAADYAYEKYGLTPVFVPVDRKQDVKIAVMAAEYTSCPHEVLTEAGSARVAIGLLRRMEVVVAMRLHALIFAAGQGVPLVGIAYNEKVTAFLEYIGENLSMPLESLTFTKLTENIDRAVELSADRGRRLEMIGRLREKEKMNKEILRKMLFEGDVPLR